MRLSHIPKQLPRVPPRGVRGREEFGLVRLPTAACGSVWRRRLRRGLAAGAIGLSFWLLLAVGRSPGAETVIQDGACAANFDPATLEVSLRSGDHLPILVSVAQTNLGKVADLERQPNKATWSLPDRKVSVTLELEGNRLSAHVLAAEPGEFTFPIVPETRAG